MIALKPHFSRFSFLTYNSVFHIFESRKRKFPSFKEIASGDASKRRWSNNQVFKGGDHEAVNLCFELALDGVGIMQGSHNHFGSALSQPAYSTRDSHDSWGYD
jgi:hypothetical protein